MREAKGWAEPIGAGALSAKALRLCDYQSQLNLGVGLRTGRSFIDATRAARNLDDRADALAALGSLAEAAIDFGDRAGAFGDGLIDLFLGEAVASADVHGGETL